MTLLGKLTLIPKLMTLATLSGAYASRLLGRTISIDAVLRHPLESGLDNASTQLIARYMRSRLWARTLAGTRLSILAGLHQHIHDFNAMIFFARAEAAGQSATRLTESHVKRGLQAVEFHLANQPRVYDQILRGWFRKQLNNLDTAIESLRLMKLHDIACNSTPPVVPLEKN